MFNRLLAFFKRKLNSKSILSCNHKYETKEDDEPFRRQCIYCGNKQIMVYYRFGPVRFEWIDDPIYKLKGERRINMAKKGGKKGGKGRGC